ncbi:hydrolase [Chelonobacter oris]|uniref:alpha/beta fold hydrolase n=1 Tax=Chelonobacter oris TaxID=505317 RepID=UPI0024475C18|nr:alpha/beta hydrolase [Chelonobacter oris]MDH2999355.1 hydrolase [Chelonobacter oris]
MPYHTLTVQNITIFYREAGDPTKPTVVLFHGFPSASHMFRELIPQLEPDYHVIAPDYPAFGQSDIPPRSEFHYTFDNIANVMDEFLTALGIKRFAMFVFDYGAPIGFRIALKDPARITAIISSNGNIYEEGLGEKWALRAKYWQHPTKALREEYKTAFAPETIIGQYTFGAPEQTVSPDGYSLDIFYTQRADYAEIQSDLIFDYQNNIKCYPAFQQYLRRYQPPLLAVWGKNDPSFIPAGANAFKRDLPNAEIHFVESGHFPLESHAGEIGDYMRNFLAGINHGIA